MTVDAKAQDPLIQCRNLTRRFRGSSFFGKSEDVLTAVDRVNLDVYPGETLGVVGESGSGKSTLARLLLRLIEPSEGSIVLRGKDITNLNASRLKPFRRQMQMIFQDPYSCLNPRLTLRRILEEPLRTHSVNRSDWPVRIEEVMDQTGLPRAFQNRHPHELSGGQRQRVGIARALILKPELIIADEPVSALDVSIQAQVLNLLKDLQKDLGLTYLFIAHDLSVVRYISDRIAVMKKGEIVEQASADELYQKPQHPYTQTLLDSIP